MKRRISILFIFMLLFQSMASSFAMPMQAIAAGMEQEEEKTIIRGYIVVDEEGEPVDLDSITETTNVRVLVDWSVEGVDVEAGETETLTLQSEISIADEQLGTLANEVGTYQALKDGTVSVSFNEAILENLESKGTFEVAGLVEIEAETKSENKVEVAETEKTETQPEATVEEEIIKEEPGNTEIEEEKGKKRSVATFNFKPMAALEGNYVSGFTFELVNKDGSTIDINNGETIVEPTQIDYANVSYDFTFPQDLDINANDTYEIILPENINVSPRAASVQPDNGPLVNYEVTADGRVVFTFTEDWNNDNRFMHIDMQTELDIQLFEEKREVEISVPYVEGEGFHAVLVGPRDGVEGSDVKTGNTFIGENTETKFRPEFAEWTIRVNDQLKVYENATIIDTLSDGHSLDTTSIEVYRIPRNYLTGAPMGNPVLVEESEYSLTSEEGSFTIGLDKVEDTYEIRYKTNIDYETVESQTTINNTARIILDGNETELEHPIDLEWGNDFEPIVKSGSVDSDDITKINWEVRYNFASHSLGEVTLTDLIDKGTVDLSTVKVFEVSVDGDGNPFNETSITVEPLAIEDNAVISIPESDGKSYVIRFTSDVPGNYVGPVTNSIDDDNPSTPPGKAVVEVNTSPGGDKSGTVKYGDDGIPYIEWKVEFNTNRVVFDSFSFTDTFNGNHLLLVEDSFVLTHSGGANLVRGTDFNVTTLNDGFDFTLETESEKEVYTLTYRTNYTPDGLKEGNVSNSVDWGWNGDVGPTAPVDHPVAGINKTGNYVTGTVDDEGTEINRQEIAWRIEFNTNKLVLETPKLVDTFSPMELDIVSDTFEITTGNTALVEDTDYKFTRKADGFEVQFIGNSEPAVYVVEYRTTIPAGNNVSSINTAQLMWQGNTEKDSAKRDLGINKPGSRKEGKTVAYEENGETLKKNEWDIRFNTSKRIIQELVLTDKYSPGEIVDQVVITDVDNNAVLDVGDDYTIAHTAGQFVITFTKQTEPVEYSLTYSTSYNLVEDRQNAVNSYEISFLGGTEKGSKTIDKPTLNLQKASTNVTGISVDENGKVTPAVISWEVKGNTDGPNYVYLKNAVFEDTIQNDQRYVENSMKLNGVPFAEDDITWTGSVEENNRTFTVKLPDGAAEHVLTFDTEIYSYPSNATRNNQSEYENRAHIVNFKGNVDGTEERESYSAYTQYFKDSSKQNPTKTGVQNSETDLIEWEAIVNADELPIKNAEIRDYVDEHQFYVGLPEVYAIINGAEVLVPANGYSYTETTVDNKPAFKITFNGPTAVTPNEEENGVHYAYKLKYKTSLLEAIIGSRTVSNTIQIVAYNTETVIETINTPTYSEKWYFGGGGSSRSLTMKFQKVDADNNNILLEGVTFEIYRVTGANNTETKTLEFTTLSNGSKELETQRAGRYILREKATLPNYVLGPDVYFIIGYDADGNTVLDKTDSNFANATRIDGDVLSVENEKLKTNVIANKIWEQDNPRPTIWFKLLRQVGEEGIPEAAPEEIKELAPGITEVSWDGVDAVDIEGNEYIYSVQEVNADGNDYTPVGYTKVEEGLTVTNTATPIEITVTKSWNDAINQDGKRPESIELQLMADGLPKGDPITLLGDNQESEWSHVFDNLPAYNSNGELIDYSVKEVNVPEGYDSSLSTDNEGNLVLTNSYTPEVIEVSGTKTWADADNQDGIRPESITVNLEADGEQIDSITVTAEDNWSYSFEDLPRFKVGEVGQEVNYTITEETVEGYDADINGFNITNTHTPEVIEVSGTKTWDDADNQDGIRAEEITVNLHADGEEIDSTTVTAADSWAYSFDDLPKYKEGAEGQEVIYTITEEVIEGYTEVIDGFNVTNIHTPEVIEVSGTKTWDDADNQDGIRPQSITVNLFADGEEIDSLEVTAADNWSYSFDNLPKFKAGEEGQEVEYTITEEAVDGYETVIDEEFNITNTHTPAVIGVNGTKTWDDADNQDGNRPSTITVNLLANGEQIDSTDVTEDDDWSYRFTDLPKFEAGEEIVYTVTENTVEGYTQTIDGFDITNQYTPGQTAVTVTKNWDDANNQDGIRSETIEIQLTADGEDQGDVVELSEANDWTHTWTELDEKAAGETIVYSVVEVTDLPEYETTVNDENHGNIIITNSYTPEVRDIAVNKSWNDEGNSDARPDSITVILLADGAASDQEVSLDETNNWQAQFTDLDKYKDGEAIEYTVEEIEVAGFVTEPITGNAADGFEITNSPAKVSVGDYVWIDENKDGLQDETDTPLEGVVLTIEDENGDPVTDVYGNPVGPQTTDENGHYSFDNLPVDKTYTVKIDREASEEVLAEFEPTKEEEGSDHSVDSSTWEATSRHLIEDGERDPTLDFGFIRPSVSVGDYVWFDENKDGLQDDTDVPLAGVVLTIVDEDGNPVTDVYGNLVGPATTDENGYYIFENLPIDGTYTVRIDQEASKEALIGYVPTIEETGDDKAVDSSLWETTSRHLTIDGEHDPTLDFGFVIEVIELTGTKSWNDADNQDGIRPESITVNLLANGEQVDSVEVTAENDWNYSFVDVPKYENGEEITYTVTENAVENYTPEYNGFDITNHYTPGETAVTVTKHWDDANNQDAIRPESIEVQLIADGEAIGDAIELSEANDWTHTWTQLAEKVDGQTIVYTVEEITNLPEYEVTVNDEDHGSIIITNACTPEEIEITGTKTWEDNNNEAGNRPTSITVNLYADGELSKTMTVSEEDNWNFSFTNLPKYNNGEEIEYTITEDPVTGYESIIDGFNIINTLIEEEPPTPSEPEVPGEEPEEEDPAPEVTETAGTGTEKSEENKLPSTATNMYNMLMIGLALLILGIAIALYQRRRETN